MAEYRPKPELFWRADANVDAARALPEWKAFHRACGQYRLAFDHIERVNGKTGQYRCHAFEIARHGDGTYTLIDKGNGDGRTVVASLAAAYRQSGITVPGAEEMLDRELAGKPVAPAAPTPKGNIEDLL